VIDKVEALLRDVAAQAVLPLFRALTEDQIVAKGPGDLVTAADREAESLLAAALLALLPGSRVVGEEAASADPSLLSLVREKGDLWLVDPVDGTANFVAGQEPFAMMVALLRDGRTVASWILEPVPGSIAVAELGAGAYRDGVRVTAPTAQPPATELRGPSFTRHLPPGAGTAISRAGANIGGLLPGHNCAGYEYPAVVRDEQNFVFFWRTLPWDHAPGVLFVEEAGGVAWRPDGTPYQPGDGRTGLLAAQNQYVWDTVRTTLLADFPN
jgi:fructose-1,6-bisphosphatase/inositol monophosphatase family enzyme